MTRTRWIVFLVILVGVFGFIIATKKSSEVKVDNVNPAKVVTKSQDIPDHVFGSIDNKTILIEYGDFQCTGCGSLYPNLHPLKEHYKDQLTFVFREFPLTGLHPNALAGATAAEAAGLQSKFWEMHDTLYENQQSWSGLDGIQRTEAFVGYAKAIGVNEKQFRKDLGSEKISQKIKRDQALGKKIGASSTPTLVLDGETLELSQWETAQKLENTLRAAIKKSSQTLPEKLN